MLGIQCISVTEKKYYLKSELQHLIHIFADLLHFL